MPKVIINGKPFNMPKTNKREYLEKSKRKIQIVVACEKMRRGGRAATVASVAKEIGYSVSTLLRNMMNDLADDEILFRISGVHWNNVARYSYTPNMQKIKEDYPEIYKEVVRKLGEQGSMF